MDNTSIQRELETLIAKRNEYTARLDQLNRDQLNELSQLSKRVKELEAKLNAAANAAPAAAQVMCRCSITFAGKDDRTVEFPVGNTVADLLNSCGADPKKFKVKRREGAGLYVEINVFTTTLTEGNHEFVASANVAAG